MLCSVSGFGSVHTAMEGLKSQLAKDATVQFIKDLEAKPRLKPIGISEIIPYLAGVTGVAEFHSQEYGWRGTNTFIICASLDHAVLLEKTDGKVDPNKFLWARDIYLTWRIDPLTDLITAQEVAVAKSESALKAALIKNFVSKIQRASLHFTIGAVYINVNAWHDCILSRMSQASIQKVNVLKVIPLKP